MLQWNPKVVAVLALLVLVAAFVGGFIEFANGLTW
jgi:hypothetical protein